MKKKTVKFAVNAVLSIILTVALTALIACSFFPNYISSPGRLFALYEKYDVYDMKTEAIWDDVEYTLYNSGVDESFMRSCMPSDELIKSLVNASAEKMLGGDPVPVSTDEYVERIKKLFSAEAKRQGITDESDIAEIADDYADDLSTILYTLTSITGESTAHTYMSKLIALLRPASYVLCAVSAILLIFMILLNRRSTQFWITVPFLSSLVLFVILLAAYSNGLFFNVTGHNSMQSAIYDLFAFYLGRCTMISGVSLAASAAVALACCFFAGRNAKREPTE